MLKNMLKPRTNKKAQEEIVGFAMIVIIVSIIILFFLVFSFSDKTEVESYEVSSFLQSALYYTTTCQTNDYLTLQNLIVACYGEERCSNGIEACTVLNQTMGDLVDESWLWGPDFPVKGYKMEAISPEGPVFSISKGNVTNQQKGAQQPIPDGSGINVLFRLYYGA